MNEIVNFCKDIITIYHGTDHILEKPLFGFGKADNDYGSGFYTTEHKDKADEWAATNGTDIAVTNTYKINLANLDVLYLDDYGALAWIAEIIYHRGARGEEANILAQKVIKEYKIDTSKADIIIGYRADDSYIDVVDSFLKNEISLEETERLFRKGNLGQQIFIKSQKAFDAIEFIGFEYVSEEITNEDEIKARIDVARFLKNRTNSIRLNNYTPIGILARDAAQQHYYYNDETNYYQTENPKETGEI